MLDAIYSVVLGGYACSDNTIYFACGVSTITHVLTVWSLEKSIVSFISECMTYIWFNDNIFFLRTAVMLSSLPKYCFFLHATILVFFKSTVNLNVYVWLLYSAFPSLLKALYIIITPIDRPETYKYIQKIQWKWLTLVNLQRHSLQRRHKCTISVAYTRSLPVFFYRSLPVRWWALVNLQSP